MMMEKTTFMLPSPSTTFPSIDVVAVWLFYSLILGYQFFYLFCFVLFCFSFFFFFSNLKRTGLINFKKSFWNFIIIIIIIILANFLIFFFFNELTFILFCFHFLISYIYYFFIFLDKSVRLKT